MEKEETQEQEVEETEDSNQEDYEQDDTTGESEGETASEETEQRQSETPDQRKARLKRQAEREAKKLGISLKEYLGLEEEGGQENHEKGSQKEEVESSKEDRRFLKREGYKTEKEQNLIIDFAKFKGVEIDEIIDNPEKYAVVHAEIKALRDKQTTPRPSVRTSTGANNTVEALVSRYRAGKYLKPDEMRQVRKHLRR